jgi:phosphatidylserine/phosphatidylglycerophosphate/cardiolipin synthase-like enzyme
MTNLGICFLFCSLACVPSRRPPTISSPSPTRVGRGISLAGELSMTRRFRCIVHIVLIVLACVPSIATRAQASETLCDPSFQNCRDLLLTLIQNETVGIDVAFWFMQDARYEAAIVKRSQAGVPVRILIDPRANPT